MWENDFSDHKKNENNSEHQDVTVMQAKQTLSAYELYWKPGNSVENSNGMVHPDGNFPDKSNTFQGIIFFPFLPKKIMTKIFCTICLVNQCSQTSCWGGWCMICFNPGTILTHSSFKNVFKSSTICQKFFTEISLQTVSVPYINNSIILKTVY